MEDLDDFDRVYVRCLECGHEREDTYMNVTTSNGSCKGCGSKNLEWFDDFGNVF